MHKVRLSISGIHLIPGMPGSQESPRTFQVPPTDATSNLQPLCHHRQSGGAGTAFQQRAHGFLASKDDFRHPHAASLENLLQLMDTWKDMGDHKTVGVDANKDVRTGKVHDLSSMVGFQAVVWPPSATDLP
jgi:hypothetical protein